MESQHQAAALQAHCSGKQDAHEEAESGDKQLLKFVWTLNLGHSNKRVGFNAGNCKLTL